MMKQSSTLEQLWQNGLVRRAFLTTIAMAAGFGIAHADIATTISGGSTAAGSYASLSTAITALNSSSITGAVTFNLAAGQTEALTGVIVLSATGTSTAPITIQKSGAGANPVLTGYTGVSDIDGMFIISGSDFVTIDGLDLSAPVAASANAAMDQGYVLARASATNGCQNITIKNCTVTLNADFGSTAIQCRKAFYTDAAAVELTPTSAAGTNSLITVKSNTLTASNGITMFATPPATLTAPQTLALRDYGNVIGGPDSLNDGNTVTYGSPIYSSASNGIAEFWNYDITVLNNRVGNYIGASTNSSLANVNRGIFLNLSSLGSSALVKGNTVSLRSIATGTTASFTNANGSVGIHCEMGNNAAAGGKIKIINNKVTAELNNPITGKVPVAGIVYDSHADSMEVSNNEITSFVFAAGLTNAMQGIGISSVGTGIQGYLKVNNNYVHDITMNSTGSITSLVSVCNGFGGFEMNRNIVSNISRPAGVAGNTNYALYVNGSQPNSTATISDNKITDINIGAGTLHGIFCSTSAASLLNINNNKIANLTTLSSGASSVYGINQSGTVLPGSSISNDTITNLTGGTSVASGIFTNGNCTNFLIHDNFINEISGTSISAAAYISGIQCQGTDAANVINIYNNKIIGIRQAAVSGPITGPACGVSTGTSPNSIRVYNNYIADITATNGTTNTFFTNAVVGLYFNAIGTGSSNYAYNNTIFPSSNGSLSGGSRFAATGILYNNGSALNDFRNNIINVQGTATAPGYIAAIRGWQTTALAPGTAPTNINLQNNVLNVNAGNDNWLYLQTTYTGSASTPANGFAYTSGLANGTNNMVVDANFNTACGLFKAFMQNNANGTFSENNLSGSSNGIFVPSGNSFAKNGGVTISNPAITTDLSGAARSAAPDMGALEFTATNSTDMAGPVITYANYPSQNCLNSPTFTAQILDNSGVNNTTNKPRFYYKRSADANNISSWKYVEGSNTSGSNYSFLVDYSQLSPAIATGDTIQYFVIAQDINGIVGNNSILLNAGACPASVALLSGDFPVSAYKNYVIKNPSALVVTATNTNLCPGTADTIIAGIARTDFTSVGTGGTASAVAPIYFHATNGKRTQIIWTAAELKGRGMVAGNIKSLSFEFTTAGSSGATVPVTMTIDMGAATTPLQTAAAGFQTPAVMTQVYTGTFTPNAPGVNKFNFSTNYNWDGISDLLVNFCQTPSAGGPSSTQPTVGYTNTGTGVTRVLSYNASATACAYSGTSASTSTSRMNVIFESAVNASAAYPNYTWNDGTSNVGTSNDSLIIVPVFPPSNIVTYNVSINDGYGCSLSGASPAITKLVSPLVLTPTTPSNTCGGTTVALDAGVGNNVVWSPATGLFTDAPAATAYTNTAVQAVFAKMNNNRYVTASLTMGACTFKDSVLVTVPGVNGATTIATITTSDSAVISGATEFHDASCALLATVTPSGGSAVSGSVKTILTIDPSVQNVAGAPYVTRHYEITPAVNGSAATANVKLYFTQAEFTAYNSYVTALPVGQQAAYPLLPANSIDVVGIANLRISKFEGSGATPNNNAGSSVISNPTVSWNSSNSIWEVSFPVTGFSTFYIHSNITGAPLPIKFASFNAVAAKTSNKLTWVMGDAKATGTFEIMHSLDGTAFETIATQKASSKNNYSFEHNNPQSIEVYQIKFTDAAGKVYYSTTQMIQRADRKQLAVMLYPNPAAQSNLKVSVMNANTATLVYSVSDILGKEVLKGNMETLNNNANAIIDISTLPNGIYNFKLLSGNDQVVRRLVVANN